MEEYIIVDGQKLAKIELTETDKECFESIDISNID